MTSGDNNTKYFHNFSSHNRVRKHIWEIKGGNSDIVTKQDALKEASIHYFKDFYKALPILNTTEQCKLIEYFPQMLNDEESSSLFILVTLEELKVVFFHFKKEKSPGPDGWAVEFFIFFFDLVGEDLLAMVDE